jgi:hypothetical protein
LSADQKEVTLHYNDLAPKLSEIEKKYHHEISGLSVEGWSLWPVFRIEIAHLMLPGDASENNLSVSPNNISQKWRKINLFGHSLLQLIFLVVSRKAVGKVMTRTLTYNRRETFQGKKYCVFFDQIIQDLGRDRFIVSEGRGFDQHEYQKAVPNQVDFYEDIIWRIAKLFEPRARRKLKGQLVTVRANAERIHPEAARSIETIAITFATHLYAWKWVYRLLKPRAVLVSVAPYRRESEMAALHELKIPVYEYEHGEITNVDLSYYYSSHVKDLKSTFPLPDQIFVFGEPQIKTMTDGGFWTADQFEVTGTPQIYFTERMGAEGFAYDPGFKNILVTPSTLPGVPGGLRDFIATYLRKGGAEKYRFYVKPHPSESLQEWVNFTQQFPKQVFIAKGSLHSFLKGAFVQLGVFTSCFQEGFYWNLPVYVLKTGPWQMANALIENGSARLISKEFTGEFERFDVPAIERSRFLNLDLKKLEKMLF